MFNFKENVADYTEKEFIELLEEIVNATSKDKSLKGKKLEKYLDTLVDHFIKITGHPKKGDLIFYPNPPEDGEPEKIIKIVKEWRRSQRLPLFKDSE
ncbi:bacteriocin immunity protein [Salmonella enterica]|uniref:bacteriocin immunity protein n=1 Tax=Salmonella enterica TaxID=28901 RepID=UPI00127B83DD|nr:bacteriocin immunity protein [Salmonella enterica]ECE6007286.1 bacteriocin immunity protein [Salmonella enterica subsp. salamae]EDU6436469.1 bacteriocin immunity protein [Salmonella enterica subsp. salamae serovar 47:b:e,n,x,z15]EHJ5090436.1 bacteriocin immunity protein [Salmonella enterica subsp. salamae serovar 16:m,t:-]EAP4932949.1 bacteriocin immunity protein [Salmonella enterica]EAV1732355.1 bacteriocin immunity protein [Salmonella enterica]